MGMMWWSWLLKGTLARWRWILGLIPVLSADPAKLRLALRKKAIIIFHNMPEGDVGLYIMLPASKHGALTVETNNNIPPGIVIRALEGMQEERVRKDPRLQAAITDWKKVQAKVDELRRGSKKRTAEAELDDSEEGQQGPRRRTRRRTQSSQQRTCSSSRGEMSDEDDEQQSEEEAASRDMSEDGEEQEEEEEELPEEDERASDDVQPDQQQQDQQQELTDEQAAAVAAAIKQLLPSMDHATATEKDVRKAVMRETGLPKSKAPKSLVKRLVDEYFSADEGAEADKGDEADEGDNAGGEAEQPSEGGLDGSAGDADNGGASWTGVMAALSAVLGADDGNTDSAAAAAAGGTAGDLAYDAAPQRPSAAAGAAGVSVTARTTAGAAAARVPGATSASAAAAARAPRMTSMAAAANTNTDPATDTSAGAGGASRTCAEAGTGASRRACAAAAGARAAADASLADSAGAESAADAVARDGAAAAVPDCAIDASGMGSAAAAPTDTATAANTSLAHQRGRRAAAAAGVAAAVCAAAVCAVEDDTSPGAKPARQRTAAGGTPLPAGYTLAGLTERQRRLWEADKDKERAAIVKEWIGQMHRSNLSEEEERDFVAAFRFARTLCEGCAKTSSFKKQTHREMLYWPMSARHGKYCGKQNNPTN